MGEKAWRKIRGEAARLAERDREVAERERRVREEEAVALGAHQVISDQEGNTPPTDVKGRSPSSKKEERLGRRGESGAWWRSGEEGKRRGHHSPPAQAKNQRGRTGDRISHRRGGMRGLQRGGSRRQSGGAGRGTWRSWSAT